MSREWRPRRAWGRTYRRQAAARFLWVAAGLAVAGWVLWGIMPSPAELAVP